MHAFRSDIADIALAGVLFAPHYARPLVRTCGDPKCEVRASADTGAAAVGQLVAGAAFAILDCSGNWAWGYACDTHRVGYVPISALKS